MSHIETTYHQLSIDSNGHVSVRKEVTFNNELEEVIATARDKEYFAKDSDIAILPQHFQDAIAAFWAGVVIEEQQEPTE
jgi:hypothetical protein